MPLVSNAPQSAYTPQLIWADVLAESFPSIVTWLLWAAVPPVPIISTILLLTGLVAAIPVALTFYCLILSRRIGENPGAS